MINTDPLLSPERRGVHTSCYLSQPVEKEYDAIVIGAGIGGLVCANYLAQAGMKVLVAERHSVPGGYCSSFWRRGFYFDAAAHYLGSCRPGGKIDSLLHDHNLYDRIELIQCDPIDVYVTGGHELRIWRDYGALLEECQRLFPKQASAIKEFLHFIAKTETMDLYVKLRTKTFEEVLDYYFKDISLKSLFSMPLGCIGLPSSRASALTAILLYREFVLDGGYYPRGGMQAFANLLATRLTEYGSNLALLTPVRSISVENGRVRGAVLRMGGKSGDAFVQARYVIANCDPFQLANSGVAWDSGRPDTSRKSFSREISVSGIIVYLGIDHEIRDVARHKSNIWYYGGRHVDDYYDAVYRGDLALDEDFLLCCMTTFHDPTLLGPGKHSLQLIGGARYAPREFWEKENLRDRVADKLINRLERFIPGVSNWISVREIAVPSTLRKFTCNYEGAMYGWASTADQVRQNDYTGETSVQGLYSVGHWTGLPTGFSGIPVVVVSGKQVARKILGRSKRGVSII